MRKKLNTEVLIQGIQSGPRIGLLGIDDAQIDQLIEEARSGNLVLLKQSEETALLNRSLAVPKFFLRNSQRTLLDLHNIYVLPRHAFNTFAQKENQGAPGVQ